MMNTTEETTRRLIALQDQIEETRRLAWERQRQELLDGSPNQETQRQQQ